jgi:hypothetical protein
MVARNFAKSAALSVEKSNYFNALCLGHLNFVFGHAKLRLAEFFFALRLCPSL